VQVERFEVGEVGEVVVDTDEVVVGYVDPLQIVSTFHD